ncbi:hypothetical protein GS934_00585 [Rhodococcus hoagii]|nr:hypothetical protein [Prescottella equi]NKZ86680.1 hypothetical protein [Prescottella equi]
MLARSEYRLLDSDADVDGSTRPSCSTTAICGGASAAAKTYCLRSSTPRPASTSGQ